jgi:hypothetical protein
MDVRIESAYDLNFGSVRVGHALWSTATMHPSLRRGSTKGGKFRRHSKEQHTATQSELPLVEHSRCTLEKKS